MWSCRKPSISIRRIHPVWSVLLIGCLSAQPGAAQGPNCPALQVEVDDAASGDLFGCALALSGDLLVGGSLRDDDNGTDSGSAYVFRRAGGGWSEFRKLLGSGVSAGDEFGL